MFGESRHRPTTTATSRGPSATAAEPPRSRRNGRTKSDERRGERRFSCERQTVESPTLRGDLIEISRSGLRLETASPPALGRSYSLRLAERRLVLHVTIVWCSLHVIRRSNEPEPGPIYHAGARLDRVERLE